MQNKNPHDQILANIMEEENVPPAITDAVFDQLHASYDSTGDPVHQFVHALNDTSESALAGPEAELRRMSLLTRFTLLSRFATSQPEAKRRGYNKSKFIAKPGRLNELRKVDVGSPPRGIVWAALEEPIANDLASGMPVDDIIDRLGLSVEMRAPMVRITYNEGDAKPPLKVPTVFDAEDFEMFRPSPKGSPHGMTRPASGKGNGYPEYVHDRCTLTDPGLTLFLPRKTSP